MLTMRRLAILLPLLFCVPVIAQEDATAPPQAVAAAYASPQATMRTFLDAMTQTPPDRAAAVKCLDSEGIVADALPDLATRLYRILNRIEFVHVDSLPDEDAPALRRADTWRFFPPQRLKLLEANRNDSDQYNRYRRVVALAPDAVIDLAKQDGGTWKFSSKTVRGIDDLWDRVRTLDPVLGLGTESLTLAERLESLFPEATVTTRFFGIRAWHWICLLILVVAGLVLDLAVRFVLAVISRRFIERRGGRAEPGTLRKTVRPFGLAVAALFWLWTMTLIGLPSEALGVIAPAVRFFAMLSMVWAAFRVTDLVGEVAAARAETTETKFDDLVVPLMRKASKILVAIFGLIYIADSFSLEIAPLLTTLGIGGVGFAFAAKDTLENVFGSITVIVDRPFQVGDWVTIDGTEGTVEELGLRSVRIRTFYNSLVIIPTANLVRAAVDNYGRRKYRRWRTHVNLEYGTTPDKIEAFCEGVREIIRLHPYTRKDYYQVWLHQFGAHSLDVLVYMFFEAPDWSTELRERHRLMLDMIRLADRLGVGFAFPTQTLHMLQGEDPPEHLQTPERGADFRAQVSGRRTVRELTENARWRENTPGAYRFRGAGEPIDEDPDDETQIESKTGGDA